ncbi:hypothetical protein C8B47_26990 [filamentous cyanobacterium CCP4]|nr:hypothetical protein C8B47_26990 [filamentous cyanobacterium CCP4]
MGSRSNNPLAHAVYSFPPAILGRLSLRNKPIALSTPPPEPERSPGRMHRAESGPARQNLPLPGMTSPCG